MVRSRITPTDRLLAAFELAGRGGLTPPEMRRAAGPKWQASLDELYAAGHVFNVRRSRFTRRPWRWIHLGPPLPPLPAAEEAPSSQMSLPVLRPGRDA